MSRFFKTLPLLIVLFSFAACSQAKLSDRDKFLQEQQQSNDIKKSELATIAGEYSGSLEGNGTNQAVKLRLEVKNVTETSGGADPIVIPKLLGSLRFILGDEELGEHIDSTIKSSEFVKATSQLSLVAQHSQFAELVITATADGTRIQGTWNVPSASRTGTLLLTRSL